MVWKESERVRDETLLAEGFERQLAYWSEGCVYCRMTGEAEEHEGQCPWRDRSAETRATWEAIVRLVGEVRE